MGGHSYRRDVKARDYVVFDPAGEPVCRGFTCPDDAVRKIEQLEHEARLIDRPCMTCRAIFKSEGPHNRMCDPCRPCLGRGCERAFDCPASADRRAGMSRVKLKPFALRRWAGLALIKQAVLADLAGVARPMISDWTRGARAIPEDVLARFIKAINERLEREGRTKLARACFDFLPTRAVLDLEGWPDTDIFAHS